MHTHVRLRITPMSLIPVCQSPNWTPRRMEVNLSSLLWIKLNWGTQFECEVKLSCNSFSTGLNLPPVLLATLVINLLGVEIAKSWLKWGPRKHECSAAALKLLIRQSFLLSWEGLTKQTEVVGKLLFLTLCLRKGRCYYVLTIEEVRGEERD